MSVAAQRREKIAHCVKARGNDTAATRAKATVVADTVTRILLVLGTSGRLADNNSDMPCVAVQLNMSLTEQGRVYQGLATGYNGGLLPDYEEIWNKMNGKSGANQVSLTHAQYYPLIGRG